MAGNLFSLHELLSQAGRLKHYIPIRHFFFTNTLENTLFLIRIGQKKLGKFAVRKTFKEFTMDLYQKVFENNRQWISEKKATNADFFEHLSKGQSPEILYIGCSDSRVTAEDMTGCKPGQMFVHRNIANLVPNNDNSSASVVEYAVAHLNVKHIVVCGHYFCGGVKAAMQASDLGILNPWLRNIRDVYRLHKDELNKIEDENDRYNRLIELNVQEQCVNVIKMATWQKSFLTSGGPTVHGWVFDLRTGELKDLKINFYKIIQQIREIYDLGTTK